MSNPVAPVYHPDLDVPTLYEIYEAGPSRFRKSLADLSDDEMMARPIENKWTIKELAFHLVDAETVAAVRFKQTVSQSEPQLAFYDQDEWANVLKYQEMALSHLETQLDLFQSIRDSIIGFLKGIPNAAWQNIGVHRRRGEMTVRDMLGLYTGHCEKHIQHILERRRLIGKPLEMKPLLPIF